jgi:hypothetical protein
MTTKAAIWAWVSTDHQTEQNQVPDLRVLRILAGEELVHVVPRWGTFRS